MFHPLVDWKHILNFKAVTVDGENALLKDGSLIVWHSESVDDLIGAVFKTAFKRLSRVSFFEREGILLESL